MVQVAYRDLMALHRVQSIRETCQQITVLRTLLRKVDNQPSLAKAKITTSIYR